MLSSVLSKSIASPPSPPHLRRLLHISSLHATTPLRLAPNGAPSPPPPPTQSPSSFPPCPSSSYNHYAATLRSCVLSRAFRPGQQLHARLLVSGLGLDAALATRLIDLYASSGHVSHARRLFDGMPQQRNVFLWNVLIRAYARDGPREAAIEMYRAMLDHGGVEPDNFTYPPVLKACAALPDVAAGREVHERVARTRWATDVFVRAGLIDMYAKCGCVDEARAVFDGTAVRDAVVWNSMIAACGQNGRPLEALALCRDMAAEGVWPTIATLVSVISAAADVAALPRGRELHGYGWRRGFSLQDKLKTSLLGMYAKSGLVRVARILFGQLVHRDLISWNSMICAYGMHGHADEALALFREMRSEAQVMPDNITFVGFYVLGHAGRFKEASNLISGMSVEPDSGIWGALLNGCKIHKNVELAELALQKLIELEPEDAGNYVLLSNIYAQSGKWEQAARVRKLMTNKGLKKIIACSWIELKGKSHGFLVGDASHPRSDEIYAELERLEGLMSQAGYVPDTTPVFHNVEDDEKRNMREIIIRDVNRYHHFVNGECSCKDHW
ncbi:hypothetical protein HU200_010111 [Digitaria exilis]|uniref:DYW domain-containing protein n=1 Tax=Digitaria exilis TaxID=1010633 RepID=A0A835FIP2_9POAL|nr:hypothetical protein HU200_010111 [Digitaria exilis]